MEKIEDIIMRHGRRGMDIIRTHLPENYCREAAEYILSWEKGNVFLFTGFYVAGYAETDGPAGTTVMAKILKEAGYTPVIVTDELCRDFFEMEGFDVVYMPFDADEDFVDEILAEYAPVGLISIERCGKNIDGHYANMRGISIDETTAAVDLFFTKTAGHIPSVGVGDGGNEIGMGNVADVIKNDLELTPCAIKTDKLVIATVSNWGAYGIAAYIDMLTENTKLAGFDFVKDYIGRTVEIGSVDGITHDKVVTVDNFPIEVDKEIIEALHQVIA